MTDPEAKKQRGRFLKRLREQHKDSVQRTKELIKQQNAIRKPIRQAMKNGPRTIPELAEATELATDTVLWHVMAMKKHGDVVEVGMNGEYYRYALSSERTG
jgi:predicted transcriptional regulator